MISHFPTEVVMKRVFIFVIVLVIIAGGTYIYLKSKGNQNNLAPEPVQHVAERGSIVLSVESTGNVAANLVVEIKCKASGEVVSLPFDVSDPVSEGDLLVELDPVDEERNVDLARVSLSQAQANLEKARLNLSIAEDGLDSSEEAAGLALEIASLRADEARAAADRLRELFDQGFAGEEEYEAAETTALTAEANVDQARLALSDLNIDETALELRRQDVILARANLESARLNLSVTDQRLEDTKVYSPIDGVVTARFVQTGQIISSGISNTGGGTTVLTVSDLSRIYVLASVDESEIGQLSPGLNVRITADAFPMMFFEGIVERIAQEGTNVSNIVTFEVKIEVTSENKSRLMPGMTSNVEIIVLESHDTLFVPVGAVSHEEGRRVVKVVTADGSTESREVEIGISNGESIEILSGLEEGETIQIDMGSTFSMWRRDGTGGGRGGMGGMGGMIRH